MSQRKKVMKTIEVHEGITDDEFLDECFGLGMVAQGAAQIKEMIGDCECKEEDMIVLRENLKEEFPGIMEKMKTGQMEEAYNDIRALFMLFKKVHSSDSADENPFSMSGPLAGTPVDKKDLN